MLDQLSADQHEAMMRRQRRRLCSFTIVCILVMLIATDVTSFTAGSSGVAVTQASLIREAMSMTTQSTHNITAARKAVRLWDAVLIEADSANKPKLQPQILAVALALQASALTRIGNDKRAVQVYSEVLDEKLRSYLLPESLRDICFGRGYALQRLMRYKEAGMQFVAYLNSVAGKPTPPGKDISDATYAAVTCALRLGNIDKAMQIIERYHEQRGLDDVTSWGDGRTAGVYGFLIHSYCSSDIMKMEPGSKYLKYAAKETGSPLFRWLYHVVSGNGTSLPKATETAFLDLAAVNQSPFDDIRLHNLDDKVLLHRLLSPTSENEVADFWPDGYIFPDEILAFNQARESTVGASIGWILKDRAGYGSYGNRILDLSRDPAILSSPAGRGIANDENNNRISEQILCQKIVESPLLIDGRKFSLRVYVVYFASSTGNDDNMKAYISTDGLAKLAAQNYCQIDASESFTIADEAFMTNSGLIEGDNAVQFDFKQLRRKLEERGLDYDALWKDIVENASSTMIRYKAYCLSGELGPTQKMSSDKFCSFLPKILGFDFLVSDQTNGILKSWLIEVNRFPGLEPRGSCDETVKRNVVEESWRLACDLAAIPNSVVGLPEKRYDPTGTSTSLMIELNLGQ